MPLDGEKENPGFGIFQQMWRRLQDVIAHRFSSSKTEKRDRSILLLLTTLLLTLFITPENHINTTRYVAGQIAVTDVRANREYLIIDRKLTAEKQAEAISRVPLAYTFDTRVVENSVDKIRRAFAMLAAAKTAPAVAGRDELTKSVADTLWVRLSPADLAALLKMGGDPRIPEAIEKSLQKIYQHKVVTDLQLFRSDQLTGISVMDTDGEKLDDILLKDEPVDLEKARLLIARSSFSDSVPNELQPALKGILAQMLKPNLQFNNEKTDELKAVASQAVTPVLQQVKQGEMIVRDGDRVTPEQEAKLAAMASETTLSGRLSSAAGVLGIVLVLLYFPYRFALKNIRKFRPSYKDLFLLVILILSHFLLLKIFSAIAPTLIVAFPSVDTSNYFLLFPFAATAVMVRIFINSEVAFVYAAICAPLAGLMFGSLPVVLYSLLGSIIGAHGVRHCDNRSIIFTAGLKVSVVNIALALSFQLFSQSLLSVQTVYCLVFAFAGGIAAAVLASGAIPLLENLFQYTTDIKLLELTNLNSPVLRELMVRAPGTYHHSVVVGNLVEAAAEAINANPLLARVAAYYHDIGKVSKAQYFIENQSPGENRHDKLSPSMSALILIAHIKEGAELARHHRLGQPIAEIIRQSHGTALIKYFYQRALEQAAPGQVVDEHEFRYPGPKPQTREAGLVLLADAVEAASRTLTDASPARIQGLVQKIINNIFIDGQLDECELTLKNLHQIAWSFNQILTGIHHQRIDYPQPAYKEKAPGPRKQHEHCDSEPPKTAESVDEEPKKGSSEDLKRLGMYY